MVTQNYTSKNDSLGLTGNLSASVNGNLKLYLTNKFVLNTLTLLQLTSSDVQVDVLQKKLFNYLYTRDFSDPFAHFGVGFGCNRIKKFEGALIHYKYSIDFGGDDWSLAAGSYQGAANALFLQEKDFETALAYANRAIDLDKTLVHPWISKGLFYMNQIGDYDSAKNCFEKALSLDQNLITNYINLAKANLYAKNELEGFKIINKAQRLFDGNSFLDDVVNGIKKSWYSSNNGIFGLNIDTRKNLIRSADKNKSKSNLHIVR